MGEELKISDFYITLENGETHKLNVDTVTIDRSYGRDYTLYSAISGFRGSGKMNITHMNKYELFKMMYKYDKRDTWVMKQYKHLKRCKNRKLLHEKRR